MEPRRPRELTALPGYETAVVRLVTGAGATAGLGVLVGRNAVVTCAHVVNTVLGRPQRLQLEPTAAEVALRFPLVEGAPVRMATVTTWVAPAPAGAGGDVAGLTLNEEAPPSATPARLSTEPGAPGERLRVFGYPDNPPRPDGVFVDLDLKGQVGQGLIQVESRGDQTIKAQPGFSGSPVWSDQRGLVVGLLQATVFADESERDAYLISPATVAEAWEEQFDYLLVPPNPYRGLEPFTAEHAEAFFGRDAEIDDLHGRVTALPVTVVVGPSGVGKSSLIQAGLIPRLCRAQAWTVALARPGQDPWYRIASSLLHAQQDQVTTRDGAALRLSLDDVDQVMRRIRSEGLAPTARFLRSQDRPLLLVVDQFEEAVASGHPDTQLMNLLLPPHETTSGVLRVVLTLRADFLPALLQIPGMGERLNQRQFFVSPLSPERVREAVERPAEARGVTFEPGLVDEIVADTAAGSLPLLEFTLTRMWHTQRQKKLTFAGYHDIGRVAGALDRFADQQLATLDPTIRAVVDRVLLRLVRTPADDLKLTTRQRVYQADLPGEQWWALKRLADARLVTTDTDPDGGAYAELAHEALITSWRRLSQLVTDNAGFLAWLTGIQRRAADGDPLPEARIAEARRWLNLRADDIPASVKTFITISQTTAEARMAELTQARTEAERARDLAERAAHRADALRLAADAELVLRSGGPLVGAMRLATQSLMVAPTRQGDSVLRRVLRARLMWRASCSRSAWQPR